jgi:hypothetical protein
LWHYSTWYAALWQSDPVEVDAGAAEAADQRPNPARLGRSQGGSMNKPWRFIKNQMAKAISTSSIFIGVLNGRGGELSVEATTNGSVPIGLMKRSYLAKLAIARLNLLLSSFGRWQFNGWINGGP